TAQASGKALVQDETFIPPLPHPGASRTGVKRADGDFGWIQIVVGQDLVRVARVRLRQSLGRSYTHFAMMDPLPHLLSFNDVAEHRNCVRMTQPAQCFDSFDLQQRRTRLSLSRLGQHDEGWPGTLV